ncbi:MAG: B12-binding domain-containing radical SAM protein [Planctomycetota bacterium]|jgi:radical SAM superfamily enzyme YgiQ (UPF0313 family)
MKCLLICPRVPDHSFLNYADVCELLGARYPATPLGLLTVAALLPQDWEFRLLDLNVRDMDVSLIDCADLVLATGMIPQQQAVLELIDLAHKHGKPIGVGGPGPTSQPQVYAEADYRVLDEGEATISAFVSGFLSGHTCGLYRSERKPDLRLSPTPRFDLVDFSMYEHADVQFTRGCPGKCEFCDVADVYGRRPRTKTPQQMLRELETLARLGYRGHVHFVDDNFIGDRQAATEFLHHLVDWSRRRHHPFFYGTNLTLGLADEPEILQLMEEADFRFVFVGIESPEKRLLVEMNKQVNIQHPIVSSVRRLYDHGMVVTAGFIVGFDHEDRSTREAIIRCVEATGVTMVLVGLLTALPVTRLGRRLAAEGRFTQDDMPKGQLIDETIDGLNFRTLRPREEILEDFITILRRIYDPKSYFDRVLDAARSIRRKPKYKPSLREAVTMLRAFTRVVRRLGFQRATMRHFWRSVLLLVLTKPQAMETGFILMALYIHLGPQTAFTIETIEAKIRMLKNEQTQLRQVPIGM